MIIGLFKIAFNCRLSFVLSHNTKLKIHAFADPAYKPAIPTTTMPKTPTAQGVAEFVHKAPVGVLQTCLHMKTSDARLSATDPPG